MDDRDQEIAELKARLGSTKAPPPAPAVAAPRKGLSWRWIFGGGFVLLIVATHAISNPPAPTKPPTAEDADEHARELAAGEARVFVPTVMKDPDSARFSRIWGMAPNVACGLVNGKNSFGAMTGDERFIFALGHVEFDDHSNRFVRDWNSTCVYRLTSAAPTGIGNKTWGSHPTADLNMFSAPTDEGLSLYVPKGAPETFQGITVSQANYGYDHGRLFSGSLYINGEANRDAVEAALKKAYGRPLSSDGETHMNRWSWHKKHVSVVMNYQDSNKQTTVTFNQGDGR